MVVHDGPFELEQPQPVCAPTGVSVEVRATAHRDLTRSFDLRLHGCWRWLSPDHSIERQWLPTHPGKLQLQRQRYRFLLR
jgi:hypothetical protein